MEKLLYPYLEKELIKFENTNKKKTILVYDVPLIYETKSEKKYDIILLAHCDENVQKRRVLTRDKISSSLFEKIVASQLTFDEKIKFNPYLINTNYKLIIYINVFLLLSRILITLRSKDEKKKINT